MPSTDDRASILSSNNHGLLQLMTTRPTIFSSNHHERSSTDDNRANNPQFQPPREVVYQDVVKSTRRRDWRGRTNERNKNNRQSPSPSLSLSFYLSPSNTMSRTTYGPPPPSVFHIQHHTQTTAAATADNFHSPSPRMIDRVHQGREKTSTPTVQRAGRTLQKAS